MDGVPFNEAIANLTDKVKIPTRFYTDLLGEANTKAFTIAGATKQALVDDFHRSITDMITNGRTIADFRKDFDEIVARHGWSYRGNRGWRTRVIYNTNMGTARAAGKWQQFDRQRERRPFLQYLTVNDGRVRAEHDAWHRLILPIDDPFWNTHYPPNGWGCRCTVRSLSQRHMDRDGLKVDNAPSIDRTPRVDERTGEDFGEVPRGIDVGWDYNVGKAWLGPELAFGRNAIALPEALQQQVLSNTELMTEVIGRPFRSWAQRVQATTTARGESRTVGYLPNNAVVFAADREIKVTSATITVSDSIIRRMAADIDDVRSLPGKLQSATTLAWNAQRKELLYVVDDATADSGQLAIAVRIAAKGEPAHRVTAVRKIGAEDPSEGDQYELIPL